MTSLRYFINTKKKEAMQKTIKFATVVLIWVLAAMLSSYTNKKNDEMVTVSLADAIKNKWVTSEYTGAGSHSGNCIRINTNNLQDKKLRISIPAGTMFKPSDDEMQNILVTQEQILALAPNQKLETFIKGYCCEASDRSPTKDINFTLASNKDPKMTQLFTFLKGKTYGDDVLQDAVWCISNQHNVSDIYAPDPTKIKPLRDELCKITGQKDTWYSTPQRHTVDADGHISHVTTEVNGLIKFKAAKEVKIHNEIHDATGKLILKNPNEFTVKPGNVEYEFGIKVQGWEKGTYYVEVYEDTRVIHKQEFKL